MRATIRLTVAILVLLSYSTASMASVPIPLLGGWGLLGIAGLLVVVGLFSINKRK